jgi:small redox-active disulfide protein 2
VAKDKENGVNMLEIKVIGPGCMNCNRLEEMCREIVTENSLQANITKVTDIAKFAELGIFMTPGLIINNKVISSGKLPGRTLLTQWIMDAVRNEMEK